MPVVAVAEVLARRLLLVLGKGGVGKSTLSLALGLVAAQLGRKVLIISLYEPRLMAEAFALPRIGGKVTPLGPGLYGVWMNQNETFDDFVRHVLRVRAVYQRLMESELYKYFAAAVPGLKELILLDRIATTVEAHEDGHGGRPFDLVVVDGPATGHGTSLLEVPDAVITGLSMGPLKRMAMRLRELFADSRRSAAVLVTLAEEMPVSETIELDERVRRGTRTALAAVVVNNFTPPPFRDRAQEDAFRDWAAAVATFTPGGAGLASAWTRSVGFQQARWATNAEHIERLRRAVRAPYYFVPFIDAADQDGGILGGAAAYLREGGAGFSAADPVGSAIREVIARVDGTGAFPRPPGSAR